MKKRDGHRSETKRQTDPVEESVIKGMLLGLALVGLLLFYFTAVKTSEEKFSQIYLDDVKEQNALQGQPFDFSFTIENLEGREAVYEYQVLLGEKQVEGRKLIVEDGASFVVAARLPPLAYGEHRVKVLVHTDGKKELLSLWFTLQAR